MFKSKAKARSLTPPQVKKLMIRCQLMHNSQQKRLVLALSFSTMRVSEIAQIKVADVVTPTGEIKTEIHLRAAMCKRRKPRTIWLSKMAKQITQEWLDYRLLHNLATTFDSAYQQMNPDNNLVLSNRGRSYSMKRKSRTNQFGEQVDYLACDALELMIRNVYQRVGLKGCSSHSGRRSAATIMNRKGVELNVIQRALGHSQPSMTLEYIDISAEQLSNAAMLAL
ncbi:site-specific integrase [Vibrio sp. Y2-5]|uniref:tyrosine-type recombinase/integrase n=1 Tax=Vibrio sp. Y2-5 TaxID=2743977 RepID=UPI001661822E|nr:site-specific integrase [Vibrio sp. Y2-5]MBD0788085.1 site-specific integrase [Vibrio sp. Y2-5]